MIKLPTGKQFVNSVRLLPRSISGSIYCPKRDTIMTLLWLPVAQEHCVDAFMRQTSSANLISFTSLYLILSEDQNTA